MSPKIEGPDVLWEDNHLIAVNKKPGQIVQGDKTGDLPLTKMLENYLKVKYGKPGNAYVGLLHRLDRPTSGVLLFGKTSKATARMNKLFHDRKIAKTYWAVVKNEPPAKEAELIHYLKKNQEQNKSYVTPPEDKSAKKAVTHYRLLKKLDRYNLLEMTISTGRHHQIRAQLAHIGCPVKGDVKYGFSRPNRDLSIHLHARCLIFVHPVRNEEVKITAPPPVDSLWKACL